MDRPRWTRWPAAALAGALLLVPVTQSVAAPEDAVMPLEQYTTTKAKTLASTYKTQLFRFYDHVDYCLPWLGVL